MNVLIREAGVVMLVLWRDDNNLNVVSALSVDFNTVKAIMAMPKTTMPNWHVSYEYVEAEVVRLTSGDDKFPAMYGFMTQHGNVAVNASEMPQALLTKCAGEANIRLDLGAKALTANSVPADRWPGDLLAWVAGSVTATAEQEEAPAPEPESQEEDSEPEKPPQMIGKWKLFYQLDGDKLVAIYGPLGNLQAKEILNSGGWKGWKYDEIKKAVKSHGGAIDQEYINIHDLHNASDVLLEANGIEVPDDDTDPPF